jgi:hypothetical protein
VLAVAAALVLAACAAPAPIAVPAELPLQGYDQGYRMRWALERGPQAVRAAGTVQTSGFTAHELTMVLYGLDPQGRIVSRGYGILRGAVDLTPRPFEVVLRPTGREASFALRVWEQVRPPQGPGR